jgi:hypothetical protein
MNKDKKDHLLLVFFILCVFLIMYVVYFVFGVLIPQKAAHDFGAADPQLEFSRRVLYAISLESNKKNLTTVVDAQGQEVMFQITYGESALKVAEHLYQSGLIHSQEAFTDLLVYLGNDKKIQSGSTLSARQ